MFWSKEAREGRRIARIKKRLWKIEDELEAARERIVRSLRDRSRSDPVLRTLQHDRVASLAYLYASDPSLLARSRKLEQEAEGLQKELTTLQSA